jgi:tetratricopeptide (TPR) repeat protein
MEKPINYKHLDWAFKEFMKVQEDMIQRGQIDAAIKNLEEGLNERLSLYPAKDEGVWKLTQLLADVNIKTAVRLLNNNQVDDSIKYLKEARKVTEPLPNSDWNENAEWVSLRKSVFKNLALYNQKKEDWNKALEYFKVSLKLDSSPVNPDPLGAANTSLTCAVILSKLNKYAESIDFA